MYSAKKKAALHSGLSLEIKQLDTCALNDDDERDQSRDHTKALPRDGKVSCLSRLTESSFDQPFQLVCLSANLTDGPDTTLNDVIQVINRLGSSAPRLIVVFVTITSDDPNNSQQLKRQLTELRVAARLCSSTRLLTLPCGGMTHAWCNQRSTAALLSYNKEAGDDWYEFWLGGVQFLVCNSLLFASEQGDLRLEQSEWLMAKLVERQWDDAARIVILCESYDDLARGLADADFPDLRATSDGCLVSPSLLSNTVTHVIDCSAASNVSGDDNAPRRYGVPPSQSETPLLLVSVTADKVASLLSSLASIDEHVALS